MEVYWTKTAQEHLDGIFRYISQNSPVYAKITVDRLTARSVQISEFPLSGRKVPEYEIDQIREVLEGSYRIIYLIKADRVEVLAVIHEAMNPFENLEE